MRRQGVAKMIFWLYLIFLIWLVIFKFNLSWTDIHRVRDLNLIPFHYENVVEGDIPLFEAFLNLLVFVPFGDLLRLVYKRSFIRNLLLIFGLSLIFEISQYVFAIGASDITDLISNTLGGAVGLGLAKLLHRERIL
ncbi:VanZ like family protein [Ignavigranum ruoffiae]|uniref:VanZ like family protein n=1 Tax=Ignavigranum ruoffiae TaxID=89093 RepID=A0A1H9EGX0_9LACT|nr:VanZ family protein [Ignavigranum ruoffiae]SEQ24513.1 VanZ like family protein [Ignavigranum ruoffiae]